MQEGREEKEKENGNIHINNNTRKENDSNCGELERGCRQ